MPKKATILVIDDELNLRRTLAFILQRAGYLVVTAADGLDTLRCLVSGSFDLVFIDLQLPDVEVIILLTVHHARIGNNRRDKTTMKRIRSWIVAAWGKIKRHNYLSIAVVGIIAVFLLLWLPIKFGEYHITKVDPTTNKVTEVDIQYRTGWDLLGLMIIPAVLAVGALLFNKTERESEQKIADQRTEADRKIAADRQREASLQSYLDKMTELLLDKDHPLRSNEENSEVRSVVRARTITTLRTLDGDRKGQILRFLYEANLIEKGNREFLYLMNADLSKANLNGAYLGEANLSRTNLSGADLSRANLSGPT